MQKQRDLPTYHGFHGAPTYYSGDGLVQSTTDPCFMEKLKIPNPSDDVMWNETFGNVDKCLGWHCTGPSCAKSTTTKIYNGYEQISYGTGYYKFNPCSHYKCVQSLNLIMCRIVTHPLMVICPLYASRSVNLVHILSLHLGDITETFDLLRAGRGGLCNHASKVEFPCSISFMN